VATALALHKQTVPPTSNFETPFDGCTLNLASEPRETHIRYAIVGAFSVGGLSAACVLKRYEP
jgi:3-oxoacyl-(acyl-carrier-protein) synthase